jgi:hypothetical protein
MDQTGKDSFSGRVIREYLRGKCGHTGWEDDGVALWQVLHDAREEDEAGAAARSAVRGTECPPMPHAASTDPVKPTIESLLQRLRAFFRFGR